MTKTHARDWIEADYLLETYSDLEKTAAMMAGEQSSGTFIKVPGETALLKERFAASVVALAPCADDFSVPSLPSTGYQAASHQKLQRAYVTLRWPLDNIGPSLPNLMAMVAGNLFELQHVTGLKILDIRLPPAFARAYPGPRFGIEGTRALSQVKDRPLIGTIIKPSIGLSVQQTAELVKTLCEAGLDFIKDDELQSDGPGCPFDERVEAVMAVINTHAQKTGRKVMYAFNLTGDLDQMRRRHDVLLAHEASCLMASMHAVGLTGFVELARWAQVPIHAHRNGWGYLNRHPLLGWSYPAWQKIWRLAGADHLHVNGLSNKFAEADDSVIASARACLTPLFADQPLMAMPVFSSGQTAAVVEATYQALQSPDLIFAAGGGILGHPNGVKAGVKALRRAWDLAIAGESVAQAALHDQDLKLALEMHA